MLLQNIILFRCRHLLYITFKWCSGIFLNSGIPLNNLIKQLQSQHHIQSQRPWNNFFFLQNMNHFLFAHNIILLYDISTVISFFWVHRKNSNYYFSSSSARLKAQNSRKCCENINNNLIIHYNFIVVFSSFLHLVHSRGGFNGHRID